MLMNFTFSNLRDEKGDVITIENVQVTREEYRQICEIRKKAKASAQRLTKISKKR